MSILTEVAPINALIVGASQGIGLGFVQQLLKYPNIDRIYGTYRSCKSSSSLIGLENSYPDKLCCLEMASKAEFDSRIKSRER